MKFRIVLTAISLIAAAGCELQSQESFDAKPFEASYQVQRNYQAVYADIVRGARKCWGSGPQVTTMPQGIQLDAQLYPDLGYGEIYSYASGTVFMPQALVRVERAGNGAVVQVKTGPQGGAEALFRRPPREWAMGSTECGSFGKR